MSEFGEVAMRRLVLLLAAPSIEYVLLPTPPNDSPAAVVVPSTKPCETRLWLVDGFTPDAKRVSMIGMFDSIGRLSTMRVSKVCVDDTDEVSSSGASPVTVMFSDIAPTSIVNGMFICCAT